MVRCKFCHTNEVSVERLELGYEWCKEEKCVKLGLSRTNRIVLVCGHKAGYQPMFVDSVSSQAYNPKRG
jgi:hypothetical protein